MLCAHTKVWRLSDTRVVRPLHVRRALEFGGDGGSQLQSSKGTPFGALLERFSRARGVMIYHWLTHARIGKGKTIARSENENDDVGEGDQELQQQAGPSTDVQAHDAAVPRWLPHRTVYTHSYTSPDLIARAHPFGVYAPGTTPGRDGQQGVRNRVARSCGV